MRFLFLALALPAFSAPTFNRDILPILQKHCQACHRPGEIAPFPLLTYEQARPWAKAIQVAVVSRKMPPWFADGGHFKNDRSLSDAEIKTVSAWALAPVPGDPKDAPAPLQFASGWGIGTPDAVFDMGADFTVPERGEIPYQFFMVHTNFKEDRWVKGIDVRPGNRAVVHHIGLSVRPPGSHYMSRIVEGKPFVPSWESVPLENLLPTSVKGLADTTAEAITTYLPGSAPILLPKGQAILIRAGSDIVFEIHYTTTGKKETDRSKVGLVFTEPPTRRIVNGFMMNDRIRIPAGAAAYRTEGSITLTAPVEVVAVQPHMHLRGSGFEVHGVLPSGEDRELLKLCRFDFNWQLAYELERPVNLPAGTVVKMIGTFDNSANNRANPNPNIDVYWGEQTSSEMFSVFLRLAVPLQQSPTSIVPKAALSVESDPLEKDSFQDVLYKSLYVWKYRLGMIEP